MLQRLRHECLSFPETTETASWGHPNFRAGKKIFLAYERVGGRPSIAIRLDKRDVDALVRRPECFLTPYGRGQWVSTWIDEPLDWRLLKRLLDRSYRLVALKRMVSALESR